MSNNQFTIQSDEELEKKRATYAYYMSMKRVQNKQQNPPRQYDPTINEPQYNVLVNGFHFDVINPPEKYLGETEKEYL